MENRDEGVKWDEVSPLAGGEDAPLAERDTLRTYPTKTYRLSRETIEVLEAIRRTNPRVFLSFDELLSELARFYLNYHRTIRGEVERWIAAHPPEDESEREDGED